jgi:cytochrome P450
VITISDYDLVKEAFRRKELRQALYDEGAVVMADCLLTLHGSEHRARRRLENRLFRREVFRLWEQEVLEPTIGESMRPFIEAGRGDLIPIGYRTTMNLTAFIAGVDRSTGSPEETEALYEFVKKFSEGATLVHSIRDHDEVRAEVSEALERFDSQFLEPSIRRRRQLLDEVAAGGRDPAELPNDVLTTLLRNQDDLDLPHDVIRREIAFYLQAGSHSTANAFTHTVDELFCWAEEHPEDLEAARTDRRFLQRCVHETLRLHPASPVSWRKAVEPVILSDGTELPVDELVVLDLETANRDPRLFGDHADRFDPHRQLAEGIPPWGHSFGGGVHACIGMELDGGLEPDPDLPPDEHLFGTVAVMVDAFLAAGGRPDPEQPPVLDPTSVRTHFSSYPVVFDGVGR